ncbi:TonB family protein [Pikeienuella sp. HZG-20]|uniref:TonB family protein n=1 Tax=Paludibacillus litoralis TaxID=3133267 RepID=UPI0030EC2A03
MKGLAEAALFLGLAAMLHAAAFWAWRGEGSRAAGQGGEAALVGVGPEMAALIEAWERPPETPPPPQARPPAESAPAPPSRAGLGPAPEIAPRASSPRRAPPPRSEPPRPEMAAEAAMRPPMARPARKPAPLGTRTRARAAPSNPPGGAPDPSPDTAPDPGPDPGPKHVADDAAAGGGEEAQPSDDGEAAALARAWGAAIRRAIEARRRAPGLIRRTRTAEVALRVARSGALLSSQIRESSGSAALDRAALRAVSAAAPYPPAPGGLAGASFDFTLPIVFRR